MAFELGMRSGLGFWFGFKMIFISGNAVARMTFDEVVAYNIYYME